MPEDVSKMLVLPQDGSAFAMRALDYLNLMFGPEHNLRPVLLYIMPSLPPVLVEAAGKNRQTVGHLKKIKHRNEALADKILGEAKDILLQYDFPADNIKTVRRAGKREIAKDIADWAQQKMADGIVLNCHGRSRVEAWFMGEVSLKLLECSSKCPVWLLRGKVKKKDVLLAVDTSENALRAIDYAGFILNGTSSRIILFHTKRTLRRFLPKSIFEDIPGLSDLWAEKATEEIAPVMEKATQMLISAGIDQNRISVETVEGSRHPSKDVLAAADEHGCGTIIIGRQGCTGNESFSMGSIARKVIDEASDKAVLIV